MLTNYVTEANILLGITVAKDRRQRRFVPNSLNFSCPVTIASNTSYRTDQYSALYIDNSGPGIRKLFPSFLTTLNSHLIGSFPHIIINFPDEFHLLY